MAAVLSEYLWFLIVGAVVAFGFGWGNGEFMLRVTAMTSLQASSIAVYACQAGLPVTILVVLCVNVELLRFRISTRV